MKKIVSTSLAALIAVAALAGTADAATRYRNTTNANAAGPQDHKAMGMMGSGMMGKGMMMRHKRKMMHRKM